MLRIGRTALAGAGLVALMLTLAPAAQACCRPCLGYCGPGVSPSAYCCAGAMPGNACGLTTCGEWLGSQPASQAVGFDPLLLMTPAQAPGESCEQVFPWLAASADQPTVS